MKKVFVAKYSELFSEPVLLIAEICACNQQKKSYKFIYDSMFSVLWIGGEGAPKLGKEVQEVSQ